VLFQLFADFFRFWPMFDYFAGFWPLMRAQTGSVGVEVSVDAFFPAPQLFDSDLHSLGGVGQLHLQHPFH